MSRFIDGDRIKIIKRLLILLAVILAIFAVINAVWFFGYKQRYNTIADHLEPATYAYDEEDDDMTRYTKEAGDYTITLKMPQYLGSGGFVTIARTSGYETSLDDEGNIIESSEMLITLYIWPKYFSDYDIGLDFWDEAEDIWEQVELTSDMELKNTDTMDDEAIEYLSELISGHQDEIDELISIARENIDVIIKQD